jgi:hypothetical protein
MSPTPKSTGAAGFVVKYVRMVRAEAGLFDSTIAPGLAVSAAPVESLTNQTELLVEAGVLLREPSPQVSSRRTSALEKEIDPKKARARTIGAKRLCHKWF